MAGAGSFPAGSGPGGFDPSSTGTSPGRLLPTAIRFEGATRDWALDDAGNYRKVTPNEQAVILSMCVKQGDIKSSPTTGNTLHKIVYLGGENLGADIENRVRTSNPIARLLAAKAIEIVRIDFETRGGKLLVATYFRDLQTDKNKVLGPVTSS